MADEIKNAGSKGYCLLAIVVFLVLFTVLVIGIYQYNFLYLEN